MALISHGAKIDSKDGEGNTALHLACQHGHDTIVKALLIFQADFLSKNNKDETPFQVALSKVTDASLMDFKDRKGILYAMHSIGANGEVDMPDNVKENRKASKV